MLPADSQDQEGRGTGSNGPPPERIFLDAVCVVHFCGAGEHELLSSIFDAKRWRIHLPDEVLNEVRAVLRSRYQKSSKGLDWLLSTGKVQRLNEITVSDTAVMVEFLELQRSHPAVAHARRSGKTRQPNEDVGECAVIAHAVVAKQSGASVCVGVDDRNAFDMAKSRGLDVYRVEEVLGFALILRLRTNKQLKAIYNELAKYGDGLPTWAANTLIQKQLGLPA